MLGRSVVGSWWWLVEPGRGSRGLLGLSWLCCLVAARGPIGRGGPSSSWWGSAAVRGRGRSLLDGPGEGALGLAVGRWLLAVGGWLLAVGGWLLAVGGTVGRRWLTVGRLWWLAVRREGAWLAVGVHARLAVGARGARQAEARSQRRSRQGVGHAVVLLQVLVLKGSVAVVDRDRQLALSQQPLLCQVVVDPVLRFSQMVSYAVAIQVVGIKAVMFGHRLRLSVVIGIPQVVAQQETVQSASIEGAQSHSTRGT